MLNIYSNNKCILGQKLLFGQKRTVRVLCIFSLRLAFLQHIRCKKRVKPQIIMTIVSLRTKKHCTKYLLNAIAATSTLHHQSKVLSNGPTSFQAL